MSVEIFLYVLKISLHKRWLGRLWTPHHDNKHKQNAQPKERVVSDVMHPRKVYVLGAGLPSKLLHPKLFITSFGTRAQRFWEGPIRTSEHQECFASWSIGALETDERETRHRKTWKEKGDKRWTDERTTTKKGKSVTPKRFELLVSPYL